MCNATASVLAPLQPLQPSPVCQCTHRDQFLHSLPMGAADTSSFASSGSSDQCEIRHTQRTASNTISYWVLQAGHFLLTGPPYNTARTHLNTAQMAKPTSSFPPGYGWILGKLMLPHSLDPWAHFRSPEHQQEQSLPIQHPCLHTDLLQSPPVSYPSLVFASK